MNINYKLLYQSQEYYLKHLGIKIIETPWVVPNNIMDITKPDVLKNKEDYYSLKSAEKSLVASGEQSFLYMIINGYLTDGKYQTITPCFRHEQQKDFFHGKYFMKNELIYFGEKLVNENGLNEIIHFAKIYFEQFIGSGVKTVSVGENAFDIVYEDVELGSYGIRTFNGISWIYGTGCAEPRLSRTIQLYKNKENRCGYYSDCFL